MEKGNKCALCLGPFRLIQCNIVTSIFECIVGIDALYDHTSFFLKCQKEFSRSVKAPRGYVLVIWCPATWTISLSYKSLLWQFCWLQPLVRGVSLPQKSSLRLRLVASLTELLNNSYSQASIGLPLGSCQNRMPYPCGSWDCPAWYPHFRIHWLRLSD